MCGISLKKPGYTRGLNFDPEPLVGHGNAGKLQQVFLNLVLNARDAMEGGGTLTVRTWSDGACARIHIQDTGQGIAQEHLPRIYDPFFTTKAARKGTARLIGHLRHRAGAWRRDRSAERARRWYTVPSGVPSVQKAGECLIPRPVRKAESSSSTTKQTFAKAWKRFSKWKATPLSSPSTAARSRKAEQSPLRSGSAGPDAARPERHGRACRYPARAIRKRRSSCSRPTDRSKSPSTRSKPARTTISRSRGTTRSCSSRSTP